ncbi:6-phospho-3-hexuloisomerase [Curtobacterium sp. MCPF17_002]|uniref:6-phospho-3-hexuloisomerase n=1 Tax=Curtobacterium sp. MCPF17_002 TaxID=2175645 RepID=UPI0021AC2266|nr:6-phospho-3-hexuloisomerase [Curtobacterium sp. MCPF17_002]WIB77379.1 6-phospho-3-hexuloisomerase [Curtobacterium sp. MCPF17_002]
MPEAPVSVTDALALIVGEADGLDSRVQGDTAAAIDLVERAGRVFVHGAGRSGLALRMTAMRLMHLGLDVHVVGEVTTPAIHEGDLLLVASGSGTTGSIVQAARTATEVGASVLAVSTTDDSPLAELATVTLVIPAATKTDRSGSASGQYAGSRFEQALVLLGDALFHALWTRSGHSADDLWPSHANLE